MIAKCSQLENTQQLQNGFQEYLTGSVIDTGELLLRDNLSCRRIFWLRHSSDGDARVASLNNRCKDAVCHYELAWLQVSVRLDNNGQLRAAHDEGARI